MATAIRNTKKDVVLTRNTVINIDGVGVHCEAGSKHTLPESDANYLISMGKAAAPAEYKPPPEQPPDDPGKKKGK